jgi:hypothetical protein
MKPRAPLPRPRILSWAGRALVAVIIFAVPAFAQLPDTMEAPPLRPADEKPAEAPAREPEDIPVPTPRPEPPKADEARKAPPGGPATTASMPADELACRAQLRELGVRFEERERLSSEDGCLIAHPIAVTALSRTVAMEPEGVLNCATARAAARFVADVVAPRAMAAFGSPLSAVRHGSAYVCRTRHNGEKISEHALGNAIDLTAFELQDGTLIEVKAYGPGDLGRRDFLRGLRSAACGPFKTVLGPGTDGDHADHLHFDLQQRRSGGTWCR